MIGFVVYDKSQDIKNIMCSNVDYHVCKRAGLAEMSDFSFAQKQAMLFSMILMVVLKGSFVNIFFLS